MDNNHTHSQNVENNNKSVVSLGCTCPNNRKIETRNVSFSRSSADPTFEPISEHDDLPSHQTPTRMAQNGTSDPPDGRRGSMTPSHGKLHKQGSSMYLNVRMPSRPDRPQISRQDSTDAVGDNGDESFYANYGEVDYDPADKVQTLINQVKDAKHRTKKLFVEMDVMTQRGEELEWREWARWVKYEEKVEDGGKRWSKPHVASLSMHHLMELRKTLLEGTFLPDIESYSISQAAENFLDSWIATQKLDPVLRSHMRTLCLLKHRHRHEKGRPEDKNKNRGRRGSEQLSRQNSSGFPASQSGVSLASQASSTDLEETEKQQNERFLRKIPKGSEVANVMVAEVEEIDQFVCGFMRLNDARILGDLSEVKLPTRFLFFLFGPKGTLEEIQECGRCLSTMLVDDVFREVAYKARDRDDLVAGIDEFLEQVTVLPPGEWDPKIRIEPPDKVPDQQYRKKSNAGLLEGGLLGKEAEEDHCDPDLVFSGRPFGGLIADIKRKVPWYPSDFKDALHIQCLASFIYIFLATLTPNVTFGGMLGQETEQYMGVMECILAAAVTGIAFALFGGQPLNILGSTGPMLVLEKIIYQFCKDNDWDFLPFRFWIGIWTAGLLLLIVAFDLSALVRYITRFTEESFASLIAFIFIYEAFKKLADIAKEDAPVRLHGDAYPEKPHCYCNFSFPSDYNASTFVMADPMLNVNLSTLNETMCDMTNETMMGGVFASGFGTVAWACDPLFYKADVFLLSFILFMGTFFIAIFLVDFRNWPCFPSWMRQLLGDFSVLIAILSMVVVDMLLGIDTPKLRVPQEFKPTRSTDRGWVVNPMETDNPWWLALAGGVPALLATILVFMDQQITAVIVNRKENKLKKGKGYHLDLLVLAIMVAVHSLLGLPWYVAATVSAIAHVNSLKKQSESTAPGERPSFLGVREQRGTALLVGIMSGAAVFITNILSVIPMPVLYGVFLFMGYSALRGMQFIDRILLLLMPVKYQPDHRYLRHVPLWKVHIFTLLQVICLVALWVVKSIKSISIVFPLLVVFTGVVRKIIECKYSNYELKYLDDVMPGSEKKDAKRMAKKNGNGKEERSDAKISAIIADYQNGKDEGNKASFFMGDDKADSPPAYSNGSHVNTAYQRDNTNLTKL